MIKYHVNPATGRAGKCSATFQCPYGDLTEDHYASAAEARKSFEEKMVASELAENEAKRAKAARRLGAPILFPKPKPAALSSDVSSALDYDYDRTYNHSEDSDGDYCRCGRIDHVEITGWYNNGEGLSQHLKSRFELPADAPLPQDLVEKIKPFVENFRSYDFDPIISGGYYGEELHGIEAPAEFMKAISDYYYDQPDAAGPDNVLSYVRGKGYATAGEYPLEAIKGMLQAENRGRLSAKVEKAKKWRVGSISINNIATPSDSQVKAAQEEPRAPKSPYAGKAQAKDLYGGVVLQKSDGSYELIDGYHRLADLKTKGKRRFQYIILSHENYTPGSRYYGYNQEPSWHKD